jgi:hypothetical protein
LHLVDQILAVLVRTRRKFFVFYAAKPFTLLAVGCDPMDQRASRPIKTGGDRVGWKTLAHSPLVPFLPPFLHRRRAMEENEEDDGGRRSRPSSGGRWRRRRPPRRCARSPHGSARRHRAVWLRRPLGAVVFPGTPMSGGRRRAVSLSSPDFFSS